MKHNLISSRRKPIRKTLYARLFNQPRKQHAATASTADDMDDSGINISRSLTIIFAIHIVAIGMIFFHKHYLSGRTAAHESVATVAPVIDSSPVAHQNKHLPVLSSGDQPYLVKKGDNYSVIAAKHNVMESTLREMNRGTDIRPGVVLRIPQGKRIVAEAPPEVVALRNHGKTSDSDHGLVEILPPVETVSAKSEAPPMLIRPVIRRENEDIPRAKPVVSGRTHTVKSGENIWRISNQYKVSQQELMSINRIADPTKLRIGQKLVLP